MFVDDEAFYAQLYVERLDSFAQVIPWTSALEAQVELHTGAGGYACLVLDVMMPAPEGWEVRTLDGLDTGIELLRLCSEAIVTAGLPVIVLTHRGILYVKDQIAMISFPEGLIEVRDKKETPPFLLEILVKRMAKRWKGLELVKV